MRLVITAAILAAAALAGCAAQPVYVWHKAGANDNDFLNDLGECRARAFSVSNPTLFQAVVVQNNCLMGKGWRQVPRN